MEYQNVTKQQIINAMMAAIESLDLPDNEPLEESDAENVMWTSYEEAAKVINPDPDKYPTPRN